MKSGWLTQKPLCPLYYLDLRQFSSCLETTAAATAERSENSHSRPPAPSDGRARSLSPGTPLPCQSGTGRGHVMIKD